MSKQEAAIHYRATRKKASARNMELPPEVVCDDLTAILARTAACICAAGRAPSIVAVAFAANLTAADLEMPGWSELAGAEGVFVCLSDEPASSRGEWWESRADIPPPFITRELGQGPKEHVDPGTNMLRFPAVIRQVGLSRTTIWRRIRAGEFPAPISLGKNSVGWPCIWIDDWVAGRPQVTYAPSPDSRPEAP